MRFFRWPKRLRELAYANPDKGYYSYMVEIEAQIVEPTRRNCRDIVSKSLPTHKIRSQLFEKVLQGYVTRAEEIRDGGILAKRRMGKREAATAGRLLLALINDPIRCVRPPGESERQ